METKQITPTQEAIKGAQMVNRYLYWMANQCNRKRIMEIYKGLDGEHLWSKLVYYREQCEDSLAADVHFWFNLDNTNRAKMMQYLMDIGYKGK